MRIGIFGGTFDPPHIGHLVLAAEAANQLNLSLVLWVLTPDPPHKKGRLISPVEQRLELLQAAIAGNPSFQLSRVEMDRPGPHYAVDTVSLLQAQYPGDELFYLIGADSLRDLMTWCRPKDLVKLVSGFGVAARPGVEINPGVLEAGLPGITPKIFFIHSPMLEISSTDIRNRIAARLPFRYFLPGKVFDLIIQKSFYIRN